MLFTFWSREVRLAVEWPEQLDHKERLRQDQSFERPGHVTIRLDEHDGRVDGDQDKLQQLQLSDVLLPPEVALVLWFPRGEQIVRVHYHVDERVELTQESHVTTWNKQIPFYTIFHRSFGPLVPASADAHALKLCSVFLVENPRNYSPHLCFSSWNRSFY